MHNAELWGDKNVKVRHKTPVLPADVYLKSRFYIKPQGKLSYKTQRCIPQKKPNPKKIAR